MKKKDTERNTFFQTNHINNKIYYHIEGKDYGFGDVTAEIKYNQITDSNGNSIIKEPIIEKKLVYSKELNINALDGIIELTDNDMSDGIYKFEISLIDNSENRSDEIKEYYIIRDTSCDSNKNLQVQTYIPVYLKNKDGICMQSNGSGPSYQYVGWNNGDYIYENDEFKYVGPNNGDHIPGFEIPENYKSITESLNKLIWYNLVDDVFIKYDDIFYSTDIKEFSYKIYCKEISKDPLDIIIVDSNSAKLPEALINHQNISDHPIECEIKIDDSLGNIKSISYIIPPKIECLNYTYDEENKTVSFQIKKLDVAFNDSIKNTIYSGKVLYRLYYAEKTTGSDINTIELDRTFVKTFEQDPYADTSDKYKFQINPEKKYVVYLQPHFKFSFGNDNKWGGETFGPLTLIDDVCVDNAIKINKSIEKPKINSYKIELITDESKKIEDRNIDKGKSKITFDIEENSLNTDFIYYPMWSEDGINYSICDSSTTELIVPTPGQKSIRLPKGVYNFDNTNVLSNFDYSKSDQERIDNLNKLYGKDGKQIKEMDYGNTECYLKLMGININDSTIVESDPFTIVFNHEHDNIPPVIDGWTKKHDLIPSSDGNSYYTLDDFCGDEALHLKKEVIVYYVPYNPIWGEEELNMFTPEEISKIPTKIYSELYFHSFIDDWSSEDYNIFKISGGITNIQTSNFEPGEYMLFARIDDLYGNSTYGAVGRINIGTPIKENKLDIKYESNKLTLNIELSEEQKSKERKNINIQKYLKSRTIFYPWLGVDEPENANAETDYSTYVKYGETKFSKEIENPLLNTFYRVKNLSYNIDERTGYFEGTGGTIEDYYGYHCSESDSSMYNQDGNYYYIPGVNYLETGTEGPHSYNYYLYDTIKDEVIATPKYLFISDTNEPVICSTKYFDSNDYGVILACDKPVLLEYVVSQRNIGEGKENIDEWLRLGNKYLTYLYNDMNDPDEYNCTDLTLITPDKKLLNNWNLNNELKDFYYVVIVHFADNTEDISQVYHYYK